MPPIKRPAMKAPRGTFKRLFKLLFRYYPVMMPLTLILILFNAIVSALPALFMGQIYGVLEAAEEAKKAGEAISWATYGGQITVTMLTLIGLYVLSLVAGAIDKQLMATMTQGVLKKMRGKMFDGMQDLPIRYFDTHNHGDIMSYYTNDIDTLRQMISQSLPQLLQSSIMINTVIHITAEVRRLGRDCDIIWRSASISFV